MFPLKWVDGLRAVVENISTQERSPLPPREHLAAFDCLVACRKQLQDTEMCNSKLAQMIESSGGTLAHNDPEMLMLKALSSATTSTLSVGLTHLQKYQEACRTEMYWVVILFLKKINTNFNDVEIQTFLKLRNKNSFSFLRRLLAYLIVFKVRKKR